MTDEHRRITDLKNALDRENLTIEDHHIAELHKAGEVVYLQKRHGPLYAEWLRTQGGGGAGDEASEEDANDRLFKVDEQITQGEEPVARGHETA